MGPPGTIQQRVWLRPANSTHVKIPHAGHLVSPPPPTGRLTTDELAIYPKIPLEKPKELGGFLLSRCVTQPDLAIYSGRYQTFLAWSLSHRVVEKYPVARDVVQRVACETLILDSRLLLQDIVYK